MHSKDVAAFVQQPPAGAFGDRFPQNKITVSGDGLVPDSCHRHSDRVDMDGLPRVGAAVWPTQAFCTTVRLTHAPVT